MKFISKKYREMSIKKKKITIFTHKYDNRMIDMSAVTCLLYTVCLSLPNLTTLNIPTFF